MTNLYLDIGFTHCTTHGHAGGMTTCETHGEQCAWVVILRTTGSGVVGPRTGALALGQGVVRSCDGTIVARSASPTGSGLPTRLLV